MVKRRRKLHRARHLFSSSHKFKFTRKAEKILQVRGRNHSYKDFMLQAVIQYYYLVMDYFVIFAQ